MRSVLRRSELGGQVGPGLVGLAGRALDRSLGVGFSAGERMGQAPPLPGQATIIRNWRGRRVGARRAVHAARRGLDWQLRRKAQPYPTRPAAAAGGAELTRTVSRDGRVEPGLNRKWGQISPV